MTPDSATPATTEGGWHADRLIRRSTILVVVLVALAAAYVSYRHAYELIHAHGETGTAARIGPGTVDGLIYASGMVLLQAARYRQRAPGLAYFGLWLGIAATLGANVAHGWSHGLIGALVSAWPAAALITCYELLMKLIRTGAAKGVLAERDHGVGADDGCPHGVALTAREAVINAYFHIRDCEGEKPVQRHLFTAFELRDRKKLAQWIKEADQTPEPAVLEESAPEPTTVGAPSQNGQAPA